MPSKTLSFVLTGIDQSASTTLGAVGVKGSSTADKISGSFSKLGTALGGEFAEIGEKLGGIFEAIGEEGHTMGSKIAATGAAVAGAGAILTAMGASDKQATDQLKQAIDSTGQSYSDYSEEIEKTVKHEENYAHSAVDTQTALRTLTTATGSAQTALEDMNVVTNLAAAKHISLNDAATLVTKILGGTGTRTLSQYGIQMKNTGDKTQDAQDALDALSKKIDGQADASMDNWGAKVDVVKTKIEDWAAKLGEKAGPAITALGPALMIVGSGMDIMSSRAAKAGAAAAAMATEVTASDAEVVVANDAVVASASGFGAVAVGLGAIGVAAYSASQGLGNYVGKAPALLGMFGSNGGTKLQSIADAMKASGDNAQTAAEQVAGYNAQQDGLADVANKAGVSLHDLVGGITGSDDQYNKLTGTLNKTKALSDGYGYTLKGLRQDYQDGSKDLAQMQAAQDAANDSTAKAAFQVDSASVAYGTAANHALAYDNALKGLNDTVLASVKGEDQYLDSLDQVTAAVKQNGTSLDDNTSKGRANREAIENSIGSINDQVKAQRASGASISTVNNTLQTNINKLVDAATKAGLNKNQVKAMIAQMALTPSKIETQIIIDDAAALAKLGTVQDKLNYLGGLASTDAAAFLSLASTVGTNVSGGTAANADRTYKHAAGGEVSGNTFDEYGLEGLRLPGGTMVIPHGQTEQMMRGGASANGGSVHVHIHTPSVVQPTQETMRAITAHLETWAAQGGALNIARSVR